MQLVVHRGGREYEVRLGGVDPARPLHRVVAGWWGEPAPIVKVDGRSISPGTPFGEAGLGNGSVIEVGDGTSPSLHGTLRCVAGPLAGRSYPLQAGTVTIGVGPGNVVIPGAAGRIRLHTGNDGCVTLRNHSRLPVRIGARTSTEPFDSIPEGAELAVAGCRFRIDVDGVLPRATGVFNRPPRLSTQHHQDVLDPPPPPPEPPKAMRFGWGALVVPLVLGIGMAILVNPRMALFAVFSPAMLVANWIEDRRRSRRDRRTAQRDDRFALEDFAGQAAAVHAGSARAARLAAAPPEEMLRCALTADPRLWERRPEHEDFMKVGIGTACVRWEPPLRSGVDPRPEVAAILNRFADLHDIPVEVDLGPGGVVGVTGDRSRVLGIARNMVLTAAVQHGPADVDISIFTERSADWDWAKWLPHVVVDGSERRRVAGTEPEIASVAGLLPSAEGQGVGRRHQLVVVDLPDLVGGGRAQVRNALRAGKKLGISGLAIAARPIDLPSMATTIIEVEPTGARIRHPDGAWSGFRPWLIAGGDARRAARSLAGVEDPECAVGVTGIPDAISLISLLGLGRELERGIEANWRRVSPGLGVPIGMGKDGPLVVDLVTDGPHALLGGTTGAGKSELLRTLVAGMAATTSPEALNFVLIDYKGGSAFDVCADLPHTVGLVTDLDGHLAQRALTCLDAELRYREHRLRRAGVSDIASFIHGDGESPLPRLLVVIDEFAGLAKEIPDFIDALVGIAQRGRSLGVHLLLATQRPNGVISDSIRANTNLRIALRMQDGADSVDVVGVGAAAAIGRTQPGRGMARLGPDDVIAFQTALVTGHSLDGGDGAGYIQPFRFAYEQQAPPAAPDRFDGPTDLERIVAACRDNFAGLPLRLPWPAPLPTAVSLADLPDHDAGPTCFALADEPDRQRQVPAVWSPAAGNLLLYGLPGSGTTTAVATLAVGLARSHHPDEMHLYVLDFDDQLLGPLRSLPHVGAVIGADDQERQTRLLRRLAQELQERRAAAAGPAGSGGRPAIITFIDNYAGFAAAFDEPGDIPVRNLLTRLVADGPGVGMYTIITAKQPGEIPTQLAAVAASKLAFRLADRYDYSGIGIPATDPPRVAGRAYEAITGRELQVALPDPEGLAAAVCRVPAIEATVMPWTIDVLPQEVSVADVITAAVIGMGRWFLPIGIGDSSLGPAGLILHDGEHALITGPARSGKSTALTTIAAVARAAGPRLRIAAMTPRRSALGDSPAVDVVVAPGDLAKLVEPGVAQLILVDDAELLDEDPYLSDLVRSRRPDVRLIAAGAPDVIRTLYGHWTQEVRRSRIGCALRPNVAADGDLWQTALPRRGPASFPAGRGYLVADGRTELVQLGRK